MEGGMGAGSIMQAGTAFWNLLASMRKQIEGAGQRWQGLKGLANLKQPQYEIDKNIQLNQQLAGQYASQGYGNQFLNLGGDMVERGLGSSINASLSSGQGLNNINNAYQTSTQAFQEFLMADAMQKSRNREVLMLANKDLAKENMKAFNWNSALPWQLDYNKFTNMVNAGMLNQNSGTEDTGSSMAQMGDAFGSFNQGGNMGGNSNQGNWGGGYGNGYGLDGSSYNYNNYG